MRQLVLSIVIFLSLAMSAGAQCGTPCSQLADAVGYSRSGPGPGYRDNLVATGAASNPNGCPGTGLAYWTWQSWFQSGVLRFMHVPFEESYTVPACIAWDPVWVSIDVGPTLPFCSVDTLYSTYVPGVHPSFDPTWLKLAGPLFAPTRQCFLIYIPPSPGGFHTTQWDLTIPWDPSLAQSAVIAQAIRLRSDGYFALSNRLDVRIHQ